MDTFVFKLVVGTVCLLNFRLSAGQEYTSCTYNLNCTGTTNLGLLNFFLATVPTYYNATDIATKDQYLWEPCQDFSYLGVYASLIQIPSASYARDCGVYRMAGCDILNGAVRFTMQSGDYTRFSRVTCKCGSGNTFTYVNEAPTLNYNFMFTSIACCPGGILISVSASISVGSVMVIIFFSLLIIYFVFGTIFQTAVRKAQGRDRLPNVDLWLSLPGLIKDGFLFTFTCGRRGGYGKV